MQKEARDRLREGEDWTLSRKLQAWEVTTCHDSVGVRNFCDKIILCGYFQFSRLPHRLPLSLSGLACGPFWSTVGSAQPTPGPPSQLALPHRGDRAHQLLGGSSDMPCVFTVLFLHTNMETDLIIRHGFIPGQNLTVPVPHSCHTIVFPFTNVL